MLAPDSAELKSPGDIFKVRLPDPELQMLIEMNLGWGLGICVLKDALDESAQKRFGNC